MKHSPSERAGIVVWSALVVWTWIHATFIAPSVSWWLDNVVSSFEQTILTSLRESFRVFTRSINGIASWFVAVFVDRRLGKEHKAQRRPRAWKAFWAKTKSSTFNAVIEQEGLVAASSSRRTQADVSPSPEPRSSRRRSSGGKPPPSTRQKKTSLLGFIQQCCHYILSIPPISFILWLFSPSTYLPFLYNNINGSHQQQHNNTSTAAASPRTTTDHLFSSVDTDYIDDSIDTSNTTTTTTTSSNGPHSRHNNNNKNKQQQGLRRSGSELFNQPAGFAVVDERRRGLVEDVRLTLELTIARVFDAFRALVQSFFRLKHTSGGGGVTSGAAHQHQNQQQRWRSRNSINNNNNNNSTTNGTTTNNSSYNTSSSHNIHDIDRNIDSSRYQKVSLPSHPPHLTGKATMEDVGLWTASDVIIMSGYPIEDTHSVTTSDGYILKMQRIPRKDSKQVVFFQHGVLDTSLSWVSNGAQGSQAFAAYDNGADVWLGNSRANPPRAHIDRDKAGGLKYWAFSMNEQGTEDIAAQLDYIHAVKCAELSAVGVGLRSGQGIAANSTIGGKGIDSSIDDDITTGIRASSSFVSGDGGGGGGGGSSSNILGGVVDKPATARLFRSGSDSALLAMHQLAAAVEVYSQGTDTQPPNEQRLREQIIQQQQLASSSGSSTSVSGKTHSNALQTKKAVGIVDKDQSSGGGSGDATAKRSSFERLTNFWRNKTTTATTQPTSAAAVNAKESPFAADQVAPPIRPRSAGPRSFSLHSNNSTSRNSAYNNSTANDLLTTTPTASEEDDEDATSKVPLSPSIGSIGLNKTKSMGAAAFVDAFPLVDLAVDAAGVYSSTGTDAPNTVVVEAEDSFEFKPTPHAVTTPAHTVTTPQPKLSSSGSGSGLQKKATMVGNNRRAGVGSTGDLQLLTPDRVSMNGKEQFPLNTGAGGAASPVAIDFQTQLLSLKRSASSSALKTTTTPTAAEQQSTSTTVASALRSFPTFTVEDHPDASNVLSPPSSLPALNLSTSSTTPRDNIIVDGGSSVGVGGVVTSSEGPQLYTLQAVAHSLGGASLLIHCVMCKMLGRPHRLNRLVLLSPAGFHYKYPKGATPFLYILPVVMRLLNYFRPGMGMPAYIPSSLLRYITFKLTVDLEQIPALNELTRAALRLLLNGDNSEWDRALQMPHYSYTSMPAMSLHTGAHLIQLMWSGKFEMYDYGSTTANIAHYGTPTPPNIAEHYHLLQGLPIDLVAGKSDGVVGFEDVLRHYEAMKAAGLRVSYKELDAGHLDVTFAVKDEVRHYVLSRLGLGGGGRGGL